MQKTTRLGSTAQLRCAEMALDCTLQTLCTEITFETLDCASNQVQEIME